MTQSEFTEKTTVSTSVPLKISVWGKLVYLAMLAGIAALAVTGIGTFAIGKAPMTGWILMAHASFAPLFAIGIALVALTWADRCRFGCKRSTMNGLSKLVFWLILVCGLVVILSGVVPMTPVFGNGPGFGQHSLYLIHRYSAIALTALVVLHLLSLIRTGRQAA